MKSWWGPIAAAVLAGLALGAAAAPQDDALQSPACLAARERLDAVMAEPKPDIAQLRAARQRAARACFRAEADAAPPSRSERPMIVLPPAGGSKPAQPVAPATPDTPAIAAPAAPQPPQVARCDAGGCWDSSGQRLNRAGNQLVNPQGGLCTQQGTVLSCP